MRKVFLKTVDRDEPLIVDVVSAGRGRRSSRDVVQVQIVSRSLLNADVMVLGANLEARSRQPIAAIADKVILTRVLIMLLSPSPSCYRFRGAGDS
jgi:hypothetical protein